MRTSVPLQSESKWNVWKLFGTLIKSILYNYAKNKKLSFCPKKVYSNPKKNAIWERKGKFDDELFGLH